MGETDYPGVLGKGFVLKLRCERDYTMHASPNRTGPKIALTCLTCMPEAALAAEPEGFALLFAGVAGAPPTTAVAVAVAEAEVPGTRRVAVAVPEADPIRPPEALVGVELLLAESPFLSTSLKFAQAIRVLFA